MEFPKTVEELDAFITRRNGYLYKHLVERKEIHPNPELPPFEPRDNGGGAPPPPGGPG